MNQKDMDNNENSGHYKNEALVKTIQDCEATCEYLTQQLFKKEQDYSERIYEAIVVRDCSDICNLTYKYVARGSVFAGSTAALCSELCYACGNECSRFDDTMSQHCSMVCYQCAIQCSNYAARKIRP
ncbi:MAG: ferredoxin [Herbinix sp.]|jgi:hypothetical protein|nr:ferredoxin [Herbinix sp.]